jgi:hypothetical protein
LLLARRLYPSASHKLKHLLPMKLLIACLRKKSVDKLHRLIKGNNKLQKKRLSSAIKKWHRSGLMPWQDDFYNPAMATCLYLMQNRGFSVPPSVGFSLFVKPS